LLFFTAGLFARLYSEENLFISSLNLAQFSANISFYGNVRFTFIKNDVSDTFDPPGIYIYVFLISNITSATKIHIETGLWCISSFRNVQNCNFNDHANFDVPSRDIVF